MGNREAWMDKLKERLLDYSDQVPASGWEQLEKALHSSAEKKIYPLRRRMMVAAAVILLILVSSVSLYFLTTPAADEIRRNQVPTLASVPDTLPDAHAPEETGVLVEQAKQPTTIGSRLAVVERKAAKTPVSEVPSTANEEKLMEKNVVVGNTEEEQPQTEQPKTNRTKSRRPSGKDKYHMPIGQKTSKKGTWSVGLSVGNSVSGDTSSEIAEAGSLTRVSMLAVSDGLVEIPEGQTVVFENGMPYLQSDGVIEDIQHHQPISVGLSVRKKLAYGFSVETGLTYTLLSSDVWLANADESIDQKLHYLGIPLRVNWNFLDSRLVTLYVSGGGMVEKCVYGKLGSESETVKPLQFSVSGMVGAQYNATRKIGLYIEPGVSYFFDDGSDTQTIRKENPFNFNIQAGIRLTY